MTTRLAGRKQLLIRLFVVGTFFVIAPTIHAQTHVAYILDAKGDWFLDERPNEFLRSGQRLPSRGVIRIQNPAADEYIVVARLNGQLLAELTCNPQKNCQRPIVLPGSSSSERSAFGIILEAAMELIFRSPKRYSVHRARGELDNLAEAVIRVDQGEIDLADSFKNMPSRSYSLSLKNISPVVGRISPTDLVNAVSIKWVREGSLRLKNARFRPGLWEIRVTPVDENPYLASSNIAWILLVDKARFEETRGTFSGSVAGMESWKQSVRPETKRRVLRACLDQLASRMRR